MREEEIKRDAERAKQKEVEEAEKSISPPEKNDNLESYQEESEDSVEPQSEESYHHSSTSNSESESESEELAAQPQQNIGMRHHLLNVDFYFNTKKFN